MLRTRLVPALCGLALAGGLAACASSATVTTTANPTVTPVVRTPTTRPSLSAERAETIYLDATAAHLCSVQSRVYTDPSAMAQAFGSKPVYQDLTDEQVTAFEHRVTSDPDFAARLTRKIASSCGAASAAP